jgi:hypothetical protein
MWLCIVSNVRSQSQAPTFLHPHLLHAQLSIKQTGELRSRFGLHSPIHTCRTLPAVLLLSLTEAIATRGRPSQCLFLRRWQMTSMMYDTLLNLTFLLLTLHSSSSKVLAEPPSILLPARPLQLTHHVSCADWRLWRRKVQPTQSFHTKRIQS